ncbi:hypothetical protein [Sneathiella sp.]|jgi:hypothetical protein|uniref:hypothetical protein n=1 Tax=Sneathiella sp. TaxID=1964365 RepID=UPI0039E2E260
MNAKSSRIVKKAALCSVVCISLTGCAETIIAGLTLSELLTAGSIGSALITGKGLGEHALDLVTGQDCRILEAVFREDRAVCEPKDSVATQGDFKGLVALLDTPAGQDIQLAEIPYKENQFPAINPTAVKSADRVLAALTRKSVTLTDRTVAYKPKPMPALTAATASFDFKQLKHTSIADVGSNDLRKRLTNGGVF